MLLLKDIVKRTQSKLDDPDSTYITEDYVMGFVNDVYEWMFNKLSLTGSQFSEEVVILPNVPADTPDLSPFQGNAQPLAMLVQPSMLRWRQPGLDASYFRRVDGPLDYPRDVPDGLPSLDSWAWMRYVIKLSKFSTAIDIEVTGTFLFDALTSGEDAVQISMNANRVFACKLAAEVGKARNMPNYIKTYEADATDALDDLMIALTRARQALTHRVGRISRAAGSSSRIVGTH